MPTPLTVVLNLQSLDFPNITNDITVFVSTQKNPTSIVTSETDSVPGHPARYWNFAGLPRTNYYVEMWEIDSGGAKLTRLAYFNVVPDSLMVYTVREDEQIKPGITPGMDVGGTEFIFDGGTVQTGGGGSSTYKQWTYSQTDPNTFLTYFSGVPAMGDSTKVDFVLNTVQHTVTVAYNNEGLQNYIKNIRIAMQAFTGWKTLIDASGTSGGTQLYGIAGAGTSATSATFTITSGNTTLKKPDYRGWNINPERRNAGGTQERDFEYSWDKTTGHFILLQSGDKFIQGEFWNIDFDPIASPAGGSDDNSPDAPDAPVDFSIKNKLVTANYTISKDDFGTNLIVEPAGGYMELTLPDPLIVKEGLPISISVFKTSICCVKIKGTIKFPYGASMFLINGESVSIYVFVRSVGVNEYRYKNDKANFDGVGRIVAIDQLSILNGLPLNGFNANNQTHARLLQYVQQLPANQKVSYANWSNNVTMFSDTDGSSFHVPNRVGLYARGASGTELAGTRLNQMMVSHKHSSPSGSGSGTPAPFGRTGLYGKKSWGDQDSDNDWWYTNDGTEIAGAPQLNPSGLIGNENRPNSFLINQFTLL